MDVALPRMSQNPLPSGWIPVGQGTRVIAVPSGVCRKERADECDAPSPKIQLLNEPFVPEIVPYGTFYIIGYNGFIPPFNRGRVRSYCELFRKYYGNGVKFARKYDASKRSVLKAAMASKLPSVIYKLSINQSIVVEYSQDRETDMFQVGRSAEPPIDFVVMDLERAAGRKRSTVSRYACRVLADRRNCNVVRAYAAGFDESCNIFLGEKAVKWHEGESVDSLTTNGVIISHPKGEFWGGDAKPGNWRELSVCGNLYTLRPYRESKERGVLVKEETNLLKDGSLIDLCGATLLWRSAEGLKKSVSKQELRESLFKSLAECQETEMSSTAFLVPRVSKRSEKACTPLVHLNCGHLQSDWDPHSNLKYIQCPVCLEFGQAAQLCMGIEPAFYVDRGPLLYAFNPCGHIANKKTVMYWSSVELPTRFNAFQPECPFCATPLVGTPGYVRLKHIE